MQKPEENYDLEAYLSEYVETCPDKEIRILNAAINAFADKGFEATRTREIAERAGIAEGTIFRYFPSKNAILESMVPLLIRVLQPKIGKPIEDILNLNPDMPIDRILVAVLKDRLQMIRDNGRFIKSVLPSLIHRAPLLEQLRVSLLPLIEGYVVQVVERGKAHGELDESVDARLVMPQLFGFVLAYSITQSVDPEREARDVEQFVESLMVGWRKR
ncbi:MAG: helix-turn-helix domain-containing protein [Christensenella sp.]|nr:helix-turn-helix domain-containing protein [Christensenella sp.]